jgi:hypothetical protein
MKHVRIIVTTDLKLILLIWKKLIHYDRKNILRHPFKDYDKAEILLVVEGMQILITMKND